MATGTETKLSLNNKKTKFKRSNVCCIYSLCVSLCRDVNSRGELLSDSCHFQVDIKVDYMLYFIFGCQQMMCIFAAIYHGIWLDHNADSNWYQYINSDGSTQTNYAELAFKNYFTTWLVLEVLIPISLYVSMELVKFTQAYLITKDHDMVYQVEDEMDSSKITKVKAQARTSNLNEELGQISYLFSDKTGFHFECIHDVFPFMNHSNLHIFKIYKM